MDWDKVFSIEKMANELEDVPKNAAWYIQNVKWGFLSGANVIIEYIKELLNDDESPEMFMEKIKLLIEKLDKKENLIDRISSPEDFVEKVKLLTKTFGLKEEDNDD